MFRALGHPMEEQDGEEFVFQIPRQAELRKCETMLVAESASRRAQRW